MGLTLQNELLVVPGSCNGEIASAAINFIAGIANPVAEAPWSVAEWAVALRFDIPRATVLVLLLSDTPLRVLGFQTP